MRLSILIILGFIIMITNCCKKDDLSSETKEFLSKVQGDWNVQEFNHVSYYLFRSEEDTIYVTDYSDPEVIYEYYSIDNPIICTIPYIENIEKWTITTKNNNLFLETQDLCHDIDHYDLYFNNIHYFKESVLLGLFTIPAHYQATMKLANQDTSITTDAMKSTRPRI